MVASSLHTGRTPSGFRMPQNAGFQAIYCDFQPKSNGGGGIRTLGRISPTAVFKTDTDKMQNFICLYLMTFQKVWLPSWLPTKIFTPVID